MGIFNQLHHNIQYTVHCTILWTVITYACLRYLPLAQKLLNQPAGFSSNWTKSTQATLPLPLRQTWIQADNEILDSLVLEIMPDCNSNSLHYRKPTVQWVWVPVWCYFQDQWIKDFIVSLYPCLSQRQGKGGLSTFLSSHYGIWCWSLLTLEWTPIFTS